MKYLGFPAKFNFFSNSALGHGPDSFKSAEKDERRSITSSVVVQYYIYVHHHCTDILLSKGV